MSESDCRISFILTKLFIPGVDIDRYVMDVTYNGENYRLKYPMADPCTIPLKNVFTQDRNILNLTIMVQQGQKYRKLAKGEINIYKKYFLTDKLEIEKFIHLELYKTHIDKMSLGSSIMNALSGVGKVFFRACLIDPEVNESKGQLKHKQEIMSIFSKSNNMRNSTTLRNNIKTYLQSKDKTINTRTERFRSLALKENEFLIKLNSDKRNKSAGKKDNKENVDEESLEDIPIEEKPYNDGLSDVSVSIIEGLEDDCVKIEEVNEEMNDFIGKIKLLFEEKFEQILPSNNEELRLYVNKITKQIQLIAENYISNLEQLQDINQKIKLQAKIFFNKYKDRKQDFNRDRKELKKKNQKLEEEINSNIEENKQVKGKFEDFKGELNYFKSLIGIKEDNAKTGKPQI